jgi:hypothetical protein
MDHYDKLQETLVLNELLVKKNHWDFFKMLEIYFELRTHPKLQSKIDVMQDALESEMGM